MQQRNQTCKTNLISKEVFRFKSLLRAIELCDITLAYASEQATMAKELNKIAAHQRQPWAPTKQERNDLSDTNIK